MTTTIWTAATPGQFVSWDMFGANTLFQINTMGEGFNATMENLGVTNIRWPGGAISEGYFDPANPDTPLAVSRTTINPQPFGDTVLTFSETMEWAAHAGAGVSIVLPTQHLIDAAGRIDWNAMEDIADFVREATSEGGKYADARITALEIGNEYWGTQLTAENYGKIANALVAILSDVLADVPEESRPEILVQSGSPYSVDFKEGGVHHNKDLTWGQKLLIANNDIIDQLDDSVREAIDGVISHFYYTPRKEVGINDVDPWTEGYIRSIWSRPELMAGCITPSGTSTPPSMAPSSPWPAR